MSHRRVIGCNPAVALATVVFSAVLAAGCAGTRAGSAYRSTPPSATTSWDLSPAQERQAEALAEYATGVSEEFRGDLDAALVRYQRALQLDPRDSRLAIRLGQIYLSKHDLTNAVSVIETSVKANPNEADLLYWLGLVYRTDNQTDKAVTVFRKALKSDPTNVNALGSLLDIYAQQDALAKGIALLDHAFRQKTDASDYWMRLGDFYALIFKQKPTWTTKIDRKRVQTCYEKALALAPDDPDVLMRLGEVYADQGDFQQAADIDARLLAKRPDTPQVREQLALNYLRADEKEKAAAVLEDIIKREPLHYGIYNYLGELYENLDKDEKAISNYQQSIVINPNQLLPYLRAALLQIKLKQFDAAAETLKAAQQKFPAAYQVPYYSGLLFSEKKEYDKAIASFADAETLAAEMPEGAKLDGRFYFYYGAACERAGNLDKAATLFQKSIQLDPEDPAAPNYLGFMWADKGVHLEEALDLIQKAVKLEPDNGAYVDSLGWVFFRLGRTEEALAQLRHAAELMKDDPTVLGHLADVLIKLGRSGEALTVLRRAKELDPDNKDISEKLQKLKDDQSAAH
ncbi:MAG TPA: tetratricopeptide repeat protein [Verrucomicrobiae bacterium]|nr:tetratricopeptide repeat protein [Verrucomicrobiae bacterium]